MQEESECCYIYMWTLHTCLGFFVFWLSLNVKSNIYFCCINLQNVVFYDKKKKTATLRSSASKFVFKLFEFKNDQNASDCVKVHFVTILNALVKCYILPLKKI